MREAVATTPFGRRALSLDQIAARSWTEHAIEDAIDQTSRPGAGQRVAVHKWKLFRALAEARSALGLSDRTLGVLNALLTFHPETALSLPARTAADAESREPVSRSTALIVFPSNRELSLRAHGMGERSLARHLASLVAAGLILRRDSPNGKRYARRARGGRGEGFSEAFGFDLSPLVARAAEFEAIAERLRQERQRVQTLRERISLHRRDIAKTIDYALTENLAGDWDAYAQKLLGFSAPVRRVQDTAALAALEDRLDVLRAEVIAELAAHLRQSGPQMRAVSPQDSMPGDPARSMSVAYNPADQSSPTIPESIEESGNDSLIDRRHHSSKTKPRIPEPASGEARTIGEPVARTRTASSDSPKRLPVVAMRPVRMGTPLSLVLEACPDILDWAPNGIRAWPDLHAAARVLRSALGVSPETWRAAVEDMGETDAAIAIAAILQRHESSSDAVSVSDPHGGPPRLAVHGSPAIRSAGGYLHALTLQARAGAFSIAPLLMANIGQRKRSPRSSGCEPSANMKHEFTERDATLDEKGIMRPGWTSLDLLRLDSSLNSPADRGARCVPQGRRG